MVFIYIVVLIFSSKIDNRSRIHICYFKETREPQALICLHFVIYLRNIVVKGTARHFLE